MKKILLFCGLLLSTVVVMAEENVLQTIEIVPVKDTYNIVFSTDKAVDVKKVVKAPNQINLTLKDVRASKNLNTIYNNVSNVDTIMVEPAGNGINVFFQAENAEAASVSFDAIAPVVPSKTTVKSMKLNNPIESYTPVYHEEVQQPKTSVLFNNIRNSSKIDGIKDSIDTDTVNDTMNKVFSFGIIGLLVFATMRLFKRKEPEMKIGLASNLNEREIDMYSGPQNIAPMGQIRNNYQKPVATMNYGLNAYQKEARNPYEQNRVYAEVNNAYNTTPSFNNMSMQNNLQQQTMVKTPVRQMTTPVNTAPVNQSNPNINNLKFLESMTAIYEKSGRHDLARGLKASLAKNNLG